MAFSLPRDNNRDMLTDQVWGLCYNASRGDVRRLRDYIHEEGLTMKGKDRTVPSALALATEQGHVGALKTLIAAGVDVNLSQFEGKNLTPLMKAAERGDVNCLITLIENGARINDCRFDNYTPLFIALEEGSCDVVKSIINVNSQARVRPNTGSLVLSSNRTWKEQHEECALLLLQAGASFDHVNELGYTGLMIAAGNGSIKVVKAMIHGGGDVNQRANDGTTALMLATRCTSMLDFRLYKECVDVIIQAGADVNAVDSSGKTALILAIQNSSQYKKKFIRTDILKLLLQAGANPNIQDTDGKTALMYAVLRNLTYCCELLMEYSAQVGIQDKCGKTPYMYVTDSRCLSLLLRNEVHLGSSGLGVTNIDNITKQLSCVLDKKDKNGKTALIHAAEGNLTDCCRLLISNFADVNLQDNDGRTAMMYVSKSDCLLELITEPTREGNIQTSSTSADLNIQDNKGKTAMIYAAERNLTVCCQLLLSQFADVDKQDNEGKTALMYASRRDVLDILLMHGANPELNDNTKRTALVHTLLSKKPARDIVDNLTVLLQCGANPVLEPCFHHLLLYLGSPHQSSSYASPYHDSAHLSKLISEGQRQVIRLLICNGFVAQPEQICNTQEQCVSLLGSVLAEGHVDVAKYLTATCYLNTVDQQDIRKLAVPQLFLHGSYFSYDHSEESWLFLQQIACQPWPLVKLAFIAVSSALGASPSRAERIRRTNLPPRLQRMLMFQEPVSRLPVSEWADIPLCFDPVEYEKLPRPRPLLYYWPFGRDLVV